MSAQMLATACQIRRADAVQARTREQGGAAAVGTSPLEAEEQAVGAHVQAGAAAELVERAAGHAVAFTNHLVETAAAADALTVDPADSPNVANEPAITAGQVDPV